MKKILPIVLAMVVIMAILTALAFAAGPATIAAGSAAVHTGAESWAALLILMIVLGLGIVAQDRRSGLF